jgi:hypothetical protein
LDFIAYVSEAFIYYILTLIGTLMLPGDINFARWYKNAGYKMYRRGRILMERLNGKMEGEEFY